MPPAGNRPEFPRQPQEWGVARSPILARLATYAVIALLILPVGCRSTRSNNRYELIEAELRTRTQELEETRAELTRLRVLQGDYGYTPGPMPVGGPVCLPGSPAYHSGLGGSAPPVYVQDISLGTGTGGVDDDGLPGDESLQIVLVPKDEDGSAVKVPGRLEIEALEINTEGMKLPIGRWEISAESLRKSWRSGLLSSGYFVPLAWDKPPQFPKVRIVARFITPDGTPFETDKDIVVRPLPDNLAGRPRPKPIRTIPIPADQLRAPPTHEGPNSPRIPPQGVPELPFPGEASSRYGSEESATPAARMGKPRSRSADLPPSLP